MDKAIELEQVCVRRDGRTVLQVDSFAVEPGELVAVVGPNGAGKSTLLAAIGLLLPVAAGQVKLFGESRNTLALRRRCALVLQDGLFLSGTVRDNISLPLALRGLQGRDAAQKVNKALALLQIDRLASRPIQALSGGERQRVNLARALVTEPDILLLDEPFSPLDPLSRTRLLEELAAIVRRQAITTLLVSHHFEEAAWFAGRVAALANGRIVQQGSLAEVVRQPADEAIAHLVGYDNLVPSTVAADRQALLLGHRLAVPMPAAFAGAAGSKMVVCAFSAEAVFWGAPPALDGAYCLGEGAVVLVVPGVHGDIIRLDCAGVSVKARLPSGSAAYEPGMRAPVWLDPSAIRCVGGRAEGEE